MSEASPAIGPDTVVDRSPAAEWSRLDSEVVVLDCDAGVLRGLNAVGSRVWELLDGSRTVGSVADQVAGEFEIDSQRAMVDVLAFLAALASRGLVTCSRRAGEVET